MSQADELLLALRNAEVDFVVVGGIAVGVHGYVRFRGGELLVCGLEHLRAMKRAAGREQDLFDLRQLDG
jgi:hypothetical protein